MPQLLKQNGHWQWAKREGGGGGAGEAFSVWLLLNNSIPAAWSERARGPTRGRKGQRGLLICPPGSAVPRGLPSKRLVCLPALSGHICEARQIGQLLGVP